MWGWLLAGVVFAADGGPAFSPDPPVFTGRSVNPRCKGYTYGDPMKFAVERTATETRGGVVVDRAVMRREVTVALMFDSDDLRTGWMKMTPWDVEVASTDPLRRAFTMAFSLDLRDQLFVEWNTGDLRFPGQDELVRRTKASLRDAQPLVDEAVATLPADQQAAASEWARGFFTDAGRVTLPYVALAVPAMRSSCMRYKSGSYDDSQDPEWGGDASALQALYTRVVGDPIGNAAPIHHTISFFDPDVYGTDVGFAASTMGLAAWAGQRANDPLVAADMHWDVTVSMDDAWPSLWVLEFRVETASSVFVERIVATRISSEPRGLVAPSPGH